MGIFTPDFASVDASFPVYDGRFRLQITKHTPFSYEKADKEGNVREIAGVHYGLEVVGQFDDDGELDDEKMGKPVSRNTVYVHTEGSWQFAKPFIMAACGYRLNQQQDANENLFQDKDIDWNLEGDPGTPAENIILGNGWDMLIGKFVDVTMKKEVTIKDDQTRENQAFNGWTPVE